MTHATTHQPQRPALSAGIAIGPILFVVAILAVLVAALAAGSGGFTASSTTDAARTNAGAIIAQGNNIRNGVARVLTGNFTEEQIRTVGTGTTDATGAGIFTAAGGGVPPQNPPGGTTPANNSWTIDTAYLLGVGVTGTPADRSSTANAAGADLVASLRVTQIICQQINRLLTGTAAGYWIVASGGTAAQVGSTRLDTTTNITAYGSLGISGRTQACVANQADNEYYYYQVLSAD